MVSYCPQYKISPLAMVLKTLYHKPHLPHSTSRHVHCRHTVVFFLLSLVPSAQKSPISTSSASACMTQFKARSPSPWRSFPWLPPALTLCSSPDVNPACRKTLIVCFCQKLIPLCYKCKNFNQKVHGTLKIACWKWLRAFLPPPPPKDLHRCLLVARQPQAF